MKEGEVRAGYCGELHFIAYSLLCVKLLFILMLLQIRSIGHFNLAVFAVKLLRCKSTV